MKPEKQRPIRSARFLLLALLLPIAAAGIIEGALRLAGYGADLALFIPAPAGFSDHSLLRVNPEVARRYFTEDRFVPRPLRDFFASRKPANGYRIFVMGESATAGFPYPGNVAFSRILQARLADQFPERTIEVVNVAVTATNSHALTDFIDEILAQQPDAILIYAGHNEFYGALGTASTITAGGFRPQLRLYLAMRRLRLFQALESGLNRWRDAGGAPAEGKAQAEAGLGFTLMGRMSDRADILAGGPVYRQARDQFEANLRTVLGKARAAGVTVVLSELVSNLRDQPPFASAASGAPSAAGEAFGEAQALERSARYDDARAAYARARDLDTLRFRAPGEFNDIIRRLAAEFGQSVVPMQSVFEAASPHGLIGSSLMLEHLHPNVEGQLLMSEAFLDTMRRQAQVSSNWDESRRKPLAYYREAWPVSDLDRAIGMLRVRRLTDYWPFRPQASSGTEWPRYRPQGEVESLAFQVANNRMRLAEARIELARRYQSGGQSDAALREYRALAADGVWDFQAQLVAAQELIQARQYSSALPFLHASLRLKDTRYAHEWIERIAARR